MEAPNETRAPPPSWINREFVESAMKNKEMKKVSVDSMKVQYACVEGAGYGSLMFRVTVFVKDEDNEEVVRKESLLVKCALESGMLKEFLENNPVFKTESQMLYEVMPQIHKTLTSLECDDFRPLTAWCYHWGQQPSEFLVLEDLSAAGFRLAEGGRPLDYQHCALVLRAYARLHAASVLLLRTQPHYKKMFSNNLFTDENSRKYFMTLVSKIMSALADEFNKCPGYEQYSGKYRTFTERLGDVAFEIFERYKKETKLPVLTHGDCWKNNMMFKYVDGVLAEVRLVDFQGSTVTSPASDLLYFLYANASEDVHRHHMDTLLAEYHSTLVDLLQRMGLEEEAETYTLQQLKQEMDRSLVKGVVFSAMNGFTLTSEKYGAEFVKAVNDVEHAGEALAKTLKNPYSLSYMKYLTPIFDSKGVL